VDSKNNGGATAAGQPAAAGAAPSAANTPPNAATPADGAPANSAASNPPAPAASEPLPEMTTRSSQVPLESHVNLVPVRVVVHDSRGNVVPDLREADFEIRQDGKVQVISHFSLETPASLEAQVVRGTSADKLEDAAAADSKPGENITLPSRFVAFVIDDAHLNLADLTRLRLAVTRYVNESVKPSERIALFTVSGQSQVDFTDDRSKVLSQLKNPDSAPRGGVRPGQ
jgi:VWFA-related protein